MAQLHQAANTPDNNETSGFTVVPEGNYTAHIYKSEWRDTKDKNGKYIYFELKILEGEYAGRVLFERLNLVNQNPIAVEIANKSLNSMCQACGMANVEDTQELHGIPMEVKVKVREAQGDYPASNEIAAYLPMEGEYVAPWDQD